MAAVDSPPIEEEFTEAQKNWDLNKLNVDLASAKRKAFTPMEKKLVRGLLCGCSPAEVAKKVYHCNELYKYIQDMLSNQAGCLIKVKNWSHVTHLLEKAGYKKTAFKYHQ
jgi:hypothetical protein